MNKALRIGKLGTAVPYTYEVKIVDQEGRPWEAEALASSALEAVSIAVRALNSQIADREVVQLSVRRLRILLSSSSSSRRAEP